MQTIQISDKQSVQLKYIASVMNLDASEKDRFTETDIISGIMEAGMTYTLNICRMVMSDITSIPDTLDEILPDYAI